MSTQHRILIFDVETAPSLAFMWRPNDQWIPKERLVESWFMLTWAAKWHGKKAVKSSSLTWEEVVTQDDTRLVAELADLYSEADAVVAHNAKKFDVPVLNTRLIGNGLEPLPPVRVIDTLPLARAAFRLEWNNLDYIAQFLGLEGKKKVDFELWRNVYYGDAKAMKRMVSYNRQDVVVLEKVFDHLRPYVKGLPRLVNAEYDGQRVCPHCGEESLHKRGFHHTAASSFQRYQCQSLACMRWSRSRKGDPHQRPDTVPLA